MCAYRMPTMALAVLGLVFILSVPAYGADEKVPQWWEVVGGILSIPATAIGVAYSYVLIRKTRLEARKTELEILEKEHELNKLRDEGIQIAAGIITPSVESRTERLLLLRFVLLYIVLLLWELASSILGTTITIGAVSLQNARLLPDLDASSWMQLVLFSVFTATPKLVRAVIIFGIGWPLFRDLNEVFGINLRSLLLPWRKAV